MKYHEWSPGNSTTYKFFIQENVSNIFLNDSKKQYSPYSEDSILLTWMKYGMTSGISIVIGTDTFLHYSYLSEKLNNINSADIAAILAFLNTTYNIPVGIPPGFDTNGLWAGGPAWLEDLETTN